MLLPRSLTTLGLALSLGASVSACLIDSSPFADASGAGNTGGTGGAGGTGATPTTTGQGASTSATENGGNGGSGATGASATTGSNGGAGGNGNGGTGAGGSTGGAGGNGGTGGEGGGPLPVEGDQCPGIPTSVAVYQSVTLSGDTTNATPDLGTPVCGGGEAGDIVYEVTATAKGKLKITLEPDFAGLLHVRKVCQDANSAGLCGPGPLEVDMEKDEVLYVIVDGYVGDPTGTFNLTLYLDGCGNGILDLSEECDDGNPTPGDTCEACKVLCSTAGSTTTQANVYLDPETLHCYMLSFNPNRNYDAAEADCIAWGGHVVALATTAEIDKLGPLLSGMGEQAWIGANDKGTEDAFVWVTDEPFIYTDGQLPWGGGQPDDFGLGEDCVEIGNNKVFNDEGCGALNNYLCERAPKGLAVVR